MQSFLQHADSQACKPFSLGPTWARDGEGEFLLPEHSLGWEVILWIMDHLILGGRPIELTPEQARWILWWYAIDEEGEFLYGSGILQRLKGWGKDPLAAIISIVELCAPCRFSHWAPSGHPVSKAVDNPNIVIAAVSRDQTQNTMKMFPLILSDQFQADFGIEILKGSIRCSANRGEIRAVTSSPRTIEGDRTTFALMNETHHWLHSNSGHEMRNVIEGNRTKMGGRALSITNAYLPGEDSVAQKQREEYEKSIERDDDSEVMYDTLEAPSDVPLNEAALLTWLPIIRGDATWLPIRAIIQSVTNSVNSPARSRRMWLNQIVSSDDALIPPRVWDAIRRDDDPIAVGEEVVLGFDGSKGKDSTALVAVRLRDLQAELLHIQERPDGPKADGWQVDKLEVDNAIDNAFRDFKVVAFFGDVAFWESWIEKWNTQYTRRLEIRASDRSAIGWDMRGKKLDSTRAHERLLSSIQEKTMGHNGDRTMRRHVLNAYRRENNFGVGFGKESPDSKRRIDIYAALMLAHEAAYRVRMERAKRRERTGYTRIG